MTVPSTTPDGHDPVPHTGPDAAPNAGLMRTAIWIAIGALITAAVVCVVMVLLGSAMGIVPRAFLTVLLMAAFAGVALLDVRLAPRRPVWFALTSMIVWVVTLLIGAVMIWMPFRTMLFGGGDQVATRVFFFLLIVLILQLAVLYVRLYVKALQRRSTPFTRVVGGVTIGLVGLLALMLVFPLMLQEWVRFHDLYWRLTVAVAILAAVGTALVPLVNALFAPRTRDERPAVPTGWPTYADGRTPLPVLPSGQPDWNAYYTGFPTAQAAPGQAAPGQAASGQAASVALPDSPAPARPAAPAAPLPDWPAPEPAPPAAPEHATPTPPPAPTSAPHPATPAESAPDPAQFTDFPPPPMPAPGEQPRP